MAQPVSLLGTLHGRWTAVYQEIDGQVAGPVATTLELQDNKFKVEHGGVVSYEGNFTLGHHGHGSPSPIVLTYEKSTNPLFLGGPRAGIFQLEGDTLKLNFSAVGHAAPTSFNTFPGAESVLSVYHRESARAAATPAVMTLSAHRSVALW